MLKNLFRIFSLSFVVSFYPDHQIEILVPYQSDSCILFNYTSKSGAKLTVEKCIASSSGVVSHETILREQFPFLPRNPFFYISDSKVGLFFNVTGDCPEKITIFDQAFDRNRVDTFKGDYLRQRIAQKRPFLYLLECIFADQTPAQPGSKEYRADLPAHTLAPAEPTSTDLNPTQGFSSPGLPGTPLRISSRTAKPVSASVGSSPEALDKSFQG